MAVQLGINGFGRIGRLVFRVAVSDPRFRVTAVNDLNDIDYLIYLLKYDTAHGKCPVFSCPHPRPSKTQQILIKYGRSLQGRGPED